MKTITVQTSHDTCEPFKKRRIVEVLMSEAGVKESEAMKIARSIERKMKGMSEGTISSLAIREEVNSQLRKRGMIEEAKKHERVGIPVAEIKKTISSHNRDNANVGRNPEAVHKYVADAALKQYALGCLPPELARKHEKGDLHLHDLEFFPARPLNCLQQDLRCFIRHGLKVDGNGEHTSSASSAKNIETLVNHAGQILMASQVFMSGGQSLSLMNVFMAPYVDGLSYERIKQAMQMLIFNLNMSYVSRGGQSLTYESPLIIKDENNIIGIVPIGKFVEEWNHEGCETLSLNRETGQYEWKAITNRIKHETASQLIKTTINDGRSVTTTSDHSLFNYNEKAEIIEVKPSEKLETILTTKQILLQEEENYLTEDEAFLIGVCIGDGSLGDNNGNPDSSMRIFLNKNETQTQKVIKEIVDTNSQWREEGKDSNTVKLTFAVKNPLLKKINRGSNSKKIPEELLSGNKGQIFSLLDGLICSDGNINRNRIEFNTTSEELANQIQFLLLRLELEYNIKSRSSESNFKRNYPVFTIQVSASSSQKLRITEDKKRPDSSDPISQQRHDYSIIQSALSRPKRLLDGGVWEYRGQFTEANRLKYNGLEANSKYYLEVWNKVKNSLPMVVKEQVQVKDEMFVYDISVQDNENFVLANGIVAHNTVFSSVNLEFGVPKLFQDETAWGPKGKAVGTYGDYYEEAEILRHAFTEVLLEGDSMGKPHLFPNTIYSLRNETFKPEHEEALRQVHELSAKYSTPYFVSHLNGYSGENANAMGCRTRLNTNWTGDWDKDTLRTGNLAYVTINLPRLAYKGDVLDGLQDILPIAEQALLIRREQALKCMGPYGLQSFLTQKMGDEPYYRIENSTLSFGFVGMNEMLKAMGLEDGMLDPEGQKIAKGVLEFMNAYAHDLTEETGYRWTILQTPAESTAHRFAELDKQFYPDKAIINGELGSAYYTNSTHVPVDSTTNLFEKIKIEEQFHPLASGGHITNMFTGEAYPDVNVLGKLTERIANKTNTGFFAYSSAFSYCFFCNTHMRGLQESCVNCGHAETVEWYDRITGYIQAVGHMKNASGGWNPGKQNELVDRRRHGL